MRARGDGVRCAAGTQVGSLSRCRVLDLGGNLLSGPVPAAALARLVGLEYLDLAKNRLTGESRVSR